MATIVTRAGKGSPLTNAEVDANFTNLNDELATALFGANNLSDLANVSTARSNLGLGNVENKSSATIRSELTSGNVTTALGFTPYNATNPSGYITSAALAAYLPLSGGTLTSTFRTNSGALIGTGNAYIYESTANAVAIRTGASGFDKYTTFAADGSLTVQGAVTATSFSGNATTATTATYLSATQQTNVITGATASMSMDTGTSARGSFTIRSTGTGDANLAGLTFYNDNYAIKLGIRADGYFGLGGWSRAAWSWYSDPSGNMVAAGNVTAYSDERKKTNWRDLPADFIEQLALVKHGIYDRTDEALTQIGVSAQSLQGVMPHAVVNGIDGWLAVSYGPAALVASVQLAQKYLSLMGRVEQLEKKVGA